MTIRQRQCLLCYLGYYGGNMDGIWGPLSQSACRAFQKDFGLDADGCGGPDTDNDLIRAVAYGVPVREEESGDGDFWEEIQYFQKSEFACKCGCGASDMAEKLIRTADKVRAYFGKPITVSSGRRCAEHNANVGGVYNSRHLYGKAMDFCVSGVPASEVLAYVQTLPEIEYAYAIDNNFVHMDME